MSFKIERKLWDDEIDTEATKLVRKGMPPYEAVEQARDIVSTKRRAKHNKSPQTTEKLLDSVMEHFPAINTVSQKKEYHSEI